MKFQDLFLPALATLVCATGAAAWNASADNKTQDVKIEQNSKTIAQTLDKVDKLADALNSQATANAVLAEQVRQLVEEQRHARQ